MTPSRNSDGMPGGDDELRQAAGLAAARMLDLTDNPVVMTAQNRMGEEAAAYALELLRAGCEPMAVAGALGGAGAAIALQVCAGWANGDLR